MAKLRDWVLRAFARLSKAYYTEDFVRVYPGDLVLDKYGREVPASTEHKNNYLNHRKFYQFAAQFVKEGCHVMDAGCGSGYGASILKEQGAEVVEAFDLSEHALKFARDHFSHCANFRKTGITDLSIYEENSFDLVTCSEVLEHIKEYGKEEKALLELHRVMKPNGLLVLGTPNDEMLPDHGFNFREIDELFARVFSRHLIFENALLPIGERKNLWTKRLQKQQTGICVEQKLNLKETVRLSGDSPEIKAGSPQNNLTISGYTIDTSLLHNTHSWIVLAKP